MRKMKAMWKMTAVQRFHGYIQYCILMQYSIEMMEIPLTAYLSDLKAMEYLNLLLLLRFSFIINRVRDKPNQATLLAGSN